jgi:spore coat polysaccharide biosynthesis predicted glycosyltransferase SpsG
MSNGESNVFIFTEAGNKFGYGHITRCISLYDELVLKGKNPLFIINGDSEVKEVIEDRNYIFDRWYDDVKNYFLNKNRDNIDGVFSIVDSYTANQKTYEEIAALSKRALYIDDTNRLEYPRGIVISPSLCKDKFSYSQKKGRTYLAGKNYIMLRKEFSDQSKRKIRETVGTILIVMGGADMLNVVPKVLKCIANMDLQKCIINIVATKNYDNLEEINKVINEIESEHTIKVKMHIDVGTKDIKALMEKSDLSISAAGQTIYELISTKLPFVCIKTAENQSRNTECLIEEGIIQKFADFSTPANDHEVQMEMLKNLIDDSLKMQARQKQMERMMGMPIAGGANRIIDTLLDGLVYKPERYNIWND